MDDFLHPRLTVPVLSTLALLLLVAMSTFSTGAPAARTGAPGDQTCNAVGCHNTFDLNSGPGSVDISAPAQYQPGEPTQLTVTVSQTGQTRFGFEITARDGNDDFVGSWELGSNQQLAGNNPEYVTHDNAPFDEGQSSFSLTWNAPAAGSGPVTFYAAGNAANGNGLNTGDQIYTTSLVVSEATNTSTQSPEIPDAIELISAFPNPLVSRTTIRFSLMRSATVQLNLYDATGRIVRSIDGGRRPAGEHRLELSAEGLAGGVYVFRLESSAGTESGSLLVVR